MKQPKTKPDTSLANNTGHFNLLTTDGARLAEGDYWLFIEGGDLQR